MTKKITINKIGYVGLTHLGINSAVASAELGYNIIWYDGDSKIIEKFIKNISLISEPGLSKLLTKNKKRLNFSNDINYLYNCDIVYISQDIITDEKNNSNLQDIQKIINNVILHIKKEAILVVLSQVPPGFTRKINWPMKQLYYQVETLIFGKAIKRALNPERLIIGCSSIE